MSTNSKKQFSRAMQLIISTIGTSMVLILLGLVVLLMLTARVVADRVKENLTVTVVLADDVQTAEAQALRDSLCDRRYVSRIDYISREQALQEQIESMGIDPTDFLGANPFSISMEIKVKPDYSCNDSLEWIRMELRDNPMVSDVMYQPDLVERLNHNLHRASFFLLVIAMLLVVISLSLIHNMVRLNIYSHRFVIHSMRLVGAEWSFIRRPFLKRSFWVGVASAFIADAFILGGIHAAAVYDEAVLRYVTMQNMAITAAAVLAIGLTITLLCTYISVTRCLHRRE